MVAEVAHSWAGIASVDVTTTDTGTEDQWALAGQLVEEGVANAIRAGGARHVRVDIQHREDDSSLVTIDDDGRGVADSVHSGLGTWRLDQIARSTWERRNSPTGTQLIVRVR